MKSPKRFRVVYEDEQLIVVDKPAGILVIPSPKGESNTLTDLVNRHLDERGIEVNAYPCHRIDRETSGLLVYAKGKSVQQAIMEQFRMRTVKKTYIAFVHGVVKKRFDTIKTSIYNNKKHKSEPAETKYRVHETRERYTIVEAEPITGRTNQIRIHMKSIGHPLVGESVYSFRRNHELKFKRAALHAKKIEFDHPVKGSRISLEAPLPADMASFLEKMN